jgi:hypothetical protein
LIGPGDRKSVQPMAARSGGVGYDQLHHFVAAGVWDSTPLEVALLKEADRLVGDERGFLVIDDTALPKKGRHSVGVAPQYASALGKTSNCQSLVSVTLASREVPVMVGLRLFLPETWTADPERMNRAGVPKDRQVASTKPEIALQEIDRVVASGTRFGCVLADAGYGSSGTFRQALSERGLLWAEWARGPYVDGPRLQGSRCGFLDAIACGHMSGLSVRSHKTAGQDGLRGARSEHASGVGTPVAPAVCLASRIDRSNHLLLLLQASVSGGSWRGRRRRAAGPARSRQAAVVAPMRPVA